MSMKSKHAATILIVLCMVALSTLASAGTITGAIYTSLGDGTIVNKNLYAQKPDVFLNGGPQNFSAAGLPNGEYYYQTTDPSGAKLLSSDNVECRKVMVILGVISGVPTHPPAAACTTGYHANGALNPANGSTPVQLIPFDDTPNNGGEYKAWISTTSTFDNATTKTDNFKVRNPNAAYISVCKYSDLNGNGTQDAGEAFLAHWIINATGVDGDAGSGVQQETNDFGCVTFSYSAFKNANQGRDVTLTEVQQDGWVQTGPLDGSNNVIVTQSFTLKQGDVVDALNFGNQTQDPCLANPGSCGNNGGSQLNVTKTAFPSYDKKYVWGLTKALDKTTINSSSTSATFNYTVTVTHDAGTASNWQLHGTIEVSNVGTVDAVNVNVTDDDPNCTVTGGTGLLIPQGTHVDLDYACTYTSQPNPFTNTASALADDGGTGSGVASVDFANATVTSIDGSITVTDTLGGSLGTVTSADASPKDLTYSYTVNGTAGTCTTQGNTATFTTSTTATTGSDNKSVTLCVGKDLTVSKTATGSYNSNIVKSGPAGPVETNGSSTLTYSVVVTESGWNVGGNITVSNPNDWETVSVNLSDALSDLGGTCVINGGNSQRGAPSSKNSPAVFCIFPPGPSAASGTNTAGAGWDSAAYFTPGSSASGQASYAFGSLTVTDAFNGTLTPKTLGTINGITASTTFTDSYTVSPRGGTCVLYPNTATITQTNQTSSWSVNACSRTAGGLSKGFWGNKNGQGIILAGASTSSVCNSGTFLRSFKPFQESALPATATCVQVASYALGVFNAANASGAAMNAMLKAQMLAAAFNVY